MKVIINKIKMLRGYKKTKLETDQFEVLNFIYHYLQLYDYYHNVSLSKEFYHIYLDDKKYTLLEIALLSGNCERTITRHIRFFNHLILKTKID